MNNRIVIFDLDGTLIDSRADLTAAINCMRQSYALEPLAQDTVTCFVGDGVRKLVERALRDAPGQADTDQALARMQDSYKQHLLDQTTLYPGVIEVLEGLRERGYVLALVTNKPAAPARAICRHFGIEALFSVIAGGDTCSNLKPHPEPIFLCLRSTNTTPDGSWIVGDNHTDLAAGRRAGLRRCYCKYGFGVLREETFEASVESLPQFLDAV